ncbi:MAG TPA: alpha/beta hydrolase [Acidimicrobiales bacterium]|nr:alpha/beta hydrolase [Acidimicrobiales bacterium]
MVVGGEDRLVWRQERVDGRRAQLAEGGRGPTVVFVHGWGLTPQAYSSGLHQLVRAGWHVIAPTLPGFGSSAGLPADQMSLAGYGAWLDRFLAAVGVDEPVSVVGHSFGGGVAITAAHAGAAVSDLVLVNSVGGGAWTAAADGGRGRAIAERPLWDWGIHFPGDVLPVPTGIRVLPRVLGEALPNLMRNPRAVWSVANLARTADLTAELADLARRRVPAQVVWSQRDRIVPRASFDAMCAILRVDGVVVDGAHSWLIAHPHRFRRAVTTALEANRLRGRRARRLRRVAAAVAPRPAGRRAVG